jgi:hypothetical protein
LAKKLTLARSARRDAHDGRQYTPVVRTAKTNRPSNRSSRVSTARQASVSLISVEAVGRSIAMVAMICSL